MFHYKKWTCDFQRTDNMDALVKGLDISPLLAAVLINRGLDNPEECRKFLYPAMDDLVDPFLMPDMEVSVDRIARAVEGGEKICIYGDYDVDGITSVSLTLKVLKAMDADVFYYIPDRMDEGYGVNKRALEEIRESGADLVITVDCGIKSFEEVAFGNALGMDTIVTDHHQCGDGIPPALGVINPKRADSSYPFKDLAGVGVAYKLCCALENRMGREDSVRRMLDIVALGTVADIVPLTGENRVLVSEGLKILQCSSNPGLKALMQVSGLGDKQVSAGHIAFMLAPRINAAGRLSKAQKGVELLLTGSREVAEEIAQRLNEENRERQLIENAILEEAAAMAGQRRDDSILVMASRHWHPGVIGIVASKITERFNKPSILFCIEKGEARGSARGITGIDLYHLLAQCSQYYKSFGGHKHAAGLTLDQDRLEEFTRKINDVASRYIEELEKRPIIKAERDLTGMDIMVEDIKQLGLMEPCGYGNPSPLFVKRRVEVLGARRVGQRGEHMKITVAEGDRRIDCIAFGWSEQDYPIKGERVDVVFSPSINLWMGRENIQFNVKDIKNIEGNTAFSMLCYDSINRLVEKESGRGETGYSRPKGINIVRVDDRVGYIAAEFQKTTGNILLVNGYRKAMDMSSALSLNSGTVMCFGSIDQYRTDKNYIVLHPLSSEEMGCCTGNLYLFDRCFFPGQLEGLNNLHGIHKVLLMGNDGCQEGEDMSGMLPGRDTLKRLYLMIRKKGVIELDRCIQELRKGGTDAITVIIAANCLEDTGLIGMQGGNLVVLPPPGRRVEIENSRPYGVFRDYMAMAGTAAIL